MSFLTVLYSFLLSNIFHLLKILLYFLQIPTAKRVLHVNTQWTTFLENIIYKNEDNSDENFVTDGITFPSITED